MTRVLQPHDVVLVVIQAAEARVHLRRRVCVTLACELVAQPLVRLAKCAVS
jgi:hypothetical protein